MDTTATPAQATYERLSGEPAAAIERAVGDATTPEQAPTLTKAAEHAWRLWLDATEFCQELGFAPGTMCDGVNMIASERVAIAEQEHASA